MPLIDTLLKTDLDPKVAEIYLVLAEGGEMTVPQMLQKTKLSRASIYEALPELVAGGYLEYRKDGREAYYRPVHPNKLLDLLNEKKRDVALLEDEMKNLVQTLTGSYNLSQHKPGVRFFEGVEGIREATFDSLNAKGEIYTFADMEAVDKYAKEMNAEYVVERVKRKIKKKMIVLDTPFTRARYQQSPPADKLLEVKFLPASLSPFKTGLQIYNNTISYSTLTEQSQIGVVIEDAKIAQMHRSIFEYLWSMLPGLQARKSIVQDM